MNKLATLLLILLTGTQTLADTKGSAEENLKEYDIELIIFEDAHARYINSEVWPQNVADETETETLSGTNTFTNVVVTKLNEISEEANSGETQTRPYQTIKTGILNKEYKRINGSSEYNVLFYGAWRQPGLDESSAFEIDLNELDNAHISKSENSITGHIKVVLARYLHFYSQLEFQRQEDLNTTNEINAIHSSDTGTKNIEIDVNNTDVSALGTNIYPMNDHRRMRSKELHYIDHPLAGILVQINTVEKTENKQ